MFAGHAAVALAVRPTLPRHSLGVLFAATYLLDLIWPVLLLTGVEHVEIDPGNTAFTPLNFVYYPWTHSLLTATVWGVVFALIVRRGRPQPARDALWLVVLVVSHWLLDFVAHRPDLPLTPGASPRLGLGLWNSIPGTLLVEGGLFLAGAAIYVRRTTAGRGRGSPALWSLLGLIVLIWVSQPFSPPPPNPEAVAGAGLLMWLFPLWAHWADRHRHVHPRASSATS